MRGSLTFKYGAMNSGKSMHLLATAYNFQERGIRFLVLKSSIDTRDGNKIHSRSLGDRECIIVKPEDSIMEILKNYEGENIPLWNVDCKTPHFLLVDEAQFLTERQVDELTDIADMWYFDVICYGLRTDFKTLLFEGSKRLFEVADKIEEIPSLCSCGKPNIFNARIDSDGNVITEGEQIEVGAEEKYMAMCRDCYYKKQKKQ